MTPGQYASVPGWEHSAGASPSPGLEGRKRIGSERFGCWGKKEEEGGKEEEEEEPPPRAARGRCRAAGERAWAAGAPAPTSAVVLDRDCGHRCPAGAGDQAGAEAPACPLIGWP